MEKRKKINAKPNLLLVTAKTFLGTYVRLGCILAIMDICLRLIQPHMLGGLLDYFRADTKVTKNQAYFYASIIVICNGFYAMFMNQYLINSFHAGFQVRTAFCSLIYRKVMHFLILKRYLTATIHILFGSSRVFHSLSKNGNLNYSLILIKNK